MIQSQIKGLKIRVQHLWYKPSFKAHMLSLVPIADLSFEKQEDGKTQQTTVLAYFNKTYGEYMRSNNIKLNPALPCIQVAGRKPKYFPIEMCELVDDQLATKDLKTWLLAKVSRMAAGPQSATERFAEIKRSHQATLVDDRTADGKSRLTNFGVSIEPQFVRMDARVMNPPNLQGSSDFFPGHEGACSLKGTNFKAPVQIGMRSSNFLFFRSDYGLTMQSCCFFPPSVPFLLLAGDRWALVNVGFCHGRRTSPGVRRESFELFQKALIRHAGSLGVNLSAPAYGDFEFNFEGPGSIRKVYDELAKRKLAGIKVIFFFTPKMKEVRISGQEDHLII